MASKARTSASRRTTRRKTSPGKASASKASSKGARSYKIGEVCRLLDIQPYVLNVWESEFPVLEPTKSKSGQRSYSEADLEVIRRIKAMVYDEGLTLPGARQRLEAQLLEAQRLEAQQQDVEPQDVQQQEGASKPALAEKTPAKTKATVKTKTGPAAESKRAGETKPAAEKEPATANRDSARPAAPVPAAPVPAAPEQPPGQEKQLLGKDTEDRVAKTSAKADELDSQQAERIKNLLQGVETALGQARELLSTLQ